jgi:glucose/arabinose dehydrogenase
MRAFLMAAIRDAAASGQTPDARQNAADRTEIRMRITLAALSFAALAAGAPGAALAQSTQDLIGRWGVAAYWRAEDAAKVQAAARGACSSPYAITRGPNGGVMMFESFEGRPREMQVSGRQIVPVGGGGDRLAKDITSWNGSMLVFNYVDEEAKRKYGNMVFVRCGGR